MRNVFLLPSLAALSVRGPLTLKDWMDGEAASPDRHLVARVWCEDGCDVAEGRTITISARETPVMPRLPHGDVVERVYMQIDDDEGGAFAMRWTATRTLQIAGRCLHDENDLPVRDKRWRGIAIDFVSVPSTTACRRPRA